MWHIKGFVIGMGYITSQYCFLKKSDANSCAGDLAKKIGLSHWKLVYKK